MGHVIEPKPPPQLPSGQKIGSCLIWIMLGVFIIAGIVGGAKACLGSSPSHTTGIPRGTYQPPTATPWATVEPPTPRATYQSTLTTVSTPSDTSSQAVSQWVEEGCSAAIELKTIYLDLDVDRMTAMASDLMYSMLFTLNDQLDVQGELVFEAMDTFGEVSTIATFEVMLDSFDDYIATCKGLGARTPGAERKR